MKPLDMEFTLFFSIGNVIFPGPAQNVTFNPLLPYNLRALWVGYKPDWIRTRQQQT
jgi:hypothetical protein